MARRDDRTRTLLLGLGISLASTVGIVGLFLVATANLWGEERERITAHFTSISGLKKNSRVLLSGKKVGVVEEVAFITAHYDCDPDTEDVGRAAGRTNACEPTLFCARQSPDEGRCAELDAYSGSAVDYEGKGCLLDEQCPAGEVCVNERFEQVNRGVDWYGPPNTCVAYQIEHPRVEVTMAIDASMLPFVRTDSRATIASKGVLGDQQVNISAGAGPSIASGARLHGSPTLLQELNRFRERVGAITARFSGNLAGIRKLGGEVRSKRQRTTTAGSLARAHAATEDIVEGRGQLGELFAPGARDELVGTLEDFRRSSDGLSRELSTWRRDTLRDVREASTSLAKVADGAQAALDPTVDGASAWLADPQRGQAFADRIQGAGDSIASARSKLDEARTSVNELRRELEAGEGPLGELVRSPDLYYSFVKAIALFDLFERNDGLKARTRTVIEQTDGWAGAGPADRARPR
jgi:phospholipid/cholesterol/gamma-HCH transport system substrate-binding protein